MFGLYNSHHRAKREQSLGTWNPTRKLIIWRLDLIISNNMYPNKDALCRVSHMMICYDTRPRHITRKDKYIVNFTFKVFLIVPIF